ncbi:MAG TPA: GGDEF domain-containing protein [Clostridiaceae bacterium]|nr:GGDEF domain-containing protein [Clostridiaceae bacterium]
MKLKPDLFSLIIMLFIGAASGILFYYAIMPLLHGGLLYFIITGIIFGITNYIIGIIIYKKFYELKKINRDLLKKVHADKLTSLLNRRALDDDISEINLNDNYSLIFIDVDNFGKFNNEFGHANGDTVLQKVSRSIRNNIRSSDKAYRYGGEEFIIFLKECNKSKAWSIAEKIRISISETDNSPFPPITVSAGVASCPEDGRDFQDILIASDKALLKAKKSGKNRSCQFDSKSFFQ